MFTAAKPIRVISLDYDACLSTAITIAQSTLVLINRLLESQYQEESLEKALLNKYKAHIEGLLRDSANDDAVANGLFNFKKGLSEQELSALKGVFAEQAAKALADPADLLDVSDIIVNYQRHFIDILKADNDQYSKTIVFVGSNRQSRYIDAVMAYNKELVFRGSALQAIPKIAQALEAQYDPLLLADIFPGDAGRGVMDEDKVLILYYQAHKVASENPGSRIDFQLYDDTMREMANNATYGLKLTLDRCSKFFPKGSIVHMRNYDFSTRAADRKTIYKDELTVEGRVPADSHFKDMIAELVESTGNRMSRDVPAIRAFAVAEIREHCRAERIEQSLRKRLLLDAIRSGATDSLKAAILKLLLICIRSPHPSTSVNESEEYKALKSLFSIWNSSASDEVKAIETARQLIANLTARELCEKIYFESGIEASLAAPAGGAGGRAASTAFASSMGAVSVNPWDKDSEKLTILLMDLLRQIETGAIHEPSSRAMVNVNGKEYRLPDGIARIYQIAISDKPASVKSAEIKSVLDEKKTPRFSRKEDTVYDYETLREFMATSSSVSLSAAPAKP
ncbi:MAG: uncharacterized protein K0S29_700 [Gammaproteobacteria bacterium]|jgi:hypothetical protein|nr:uncharacterized protein [Gammaproteobacteria bacterium]